MVNSVATAKTKVIGYWITTALLMFAIESGGVRN
jgi:hypothetical protein